MLRAKLRAEEGWTGLSDTTSKMVLLNWLLFWGRGRFAAATGDLEKILLSNRDRSVRGTLGWNGEAGSLKTQLWLRVGSRAIEERLFLSSRSSPPKSVDLDCFW